MTIIVLNAHNYKHVKIHVRQSKNMSICPLELVVVYLGWIPAKILENARVI